MARESNSNSVDLMEVDLARNIIDDLGITDWSKACQTQRRKLS